VGSGVATDVITVAEKLQELLNQKVDTKVTGQFRIGDIRHNYADISKLKELLNYTPSVDLESGIASFVNWVSNERVMADGYELSLQQLKKRGLLK